MRTSHLKFWTILLVAIFLCNCGIFQKDLKSFSEMTPKEKAIFITKVYNQQYDSYVKLIKKNDLGEAEQKVLTLKYDALKELHPIIDAYNTYVNNGVIPPERIEKLAIEVVNKIINLGD